MTTYTNTHAQFDCAIDGTPFFLGPTAEWPLVRQTSEFKRQQIDQTNEPGEQSLTSWWYRSQVSFHLGAGLKYFDPIRGNPTSPFRFADSAGVNVWEPGEVSLLRSTSRYYSMAGWGSTCAFYYGSDNGLLVEDGNVLKKVLSDGTTSTLDYNGATADTTIKDLETSATYAFIADNDGIYRWKMSFTGSATKVYNFPGSVDRARLRWAKERLFCAVNEKLYELAALPGSPPKALPADYTTDKAFGRLLYTHPEEDWRWRGIEAGPDCIYFGGYAGASGATYGGRSIIYSSTVEVANIDDVPQVTQPSVVAELPRGEYLRAMLSYGGVYLILGTTKGVRVCAMTGNGGLTLGPLMIEADDKVDDLTGWGSYIYAGGADVDGYAGIYRIDLTAPVDDTGMRFAYAKDLASGKSSASDYVKQLCMVGKTGRVALMVSSSGLWVEHATDKVASGWLQTGLIRMDTWTDKVYAYLRSVWDPTKYGSIRPYWLTETGSATALANDTATYGVVKLDTAGSDGEPRMGLSYKWVLTRYGSDASKGPVFQGYQARSLPANVVQREIRLPLLCYRRERMRSGRTVERHVWARIAAIEALERSGKVTTYQDFLTGESRSVTVSNVQYVSDRPVQNRAEGADPGGMLIVTLRSAD